MEKEIITPKTVSHCKKMKIMKPLSLQTSGNLAPLSGNSLVLEFVELSAGAARWDNDLVIDSERNMYFLIKYNPEF